jgi:predicted nucleic acid-binding protein
MEPLVVDASITVAWCFDDEATPYTEELLNWCSAGVNVHVASIWPLEVTNVLLTAGRKGRITEREIEEFIELLSRFSIQIDPVSMRRSAVEVRKLAQKHNLTSYDAAYLELAARKGLPLASLDTDLKKAAAALGVRLI